MTRTNGVAGLLAVLAVGALPAVAQNGPYQYHAVTPCRVFDSRTDAGGTVLSPDAMIVKGINHLRIQGSCGRKVKLESKRGLRIKNSRQLRHPIRFGEERGVAAVRT